MSSPFFFFHLFSKYLPYMYISSHLFIFLLNFFLMDIYGDGVEEVMDGKSTVDELCLMQEWNGHKMWHFCRTQNQLPIVPIHNLHRSKWVAIIKWLGVNLVNWHFKLSWVKNKTIKLCYRPLPGQKQPYSACFGQTLPQFILWIIPDNGTFSCKLSSPCYYAFNIQFHA